MCCRLSRLNLLNEPQTLRQTQHRRVEDLKKAATRMLNVERWTFEGRTCHVPTLILLSYWRPKPNGASQELDDEDDNDDEAKSLLTFEWPRKVYFAPAPTRRGVIIHGKVWAQAVALPISKSARKGPAAKTLSSKVATPYFRTHVAGHFCDYHLPLAASKLHK